MGKEEFEKLEKKLRSQYEAINQAIDNIRKELERHANGKKLKGDEIVGWLGEIYAKFLLDGTLVPDNLDYDVQTGAKKVSVKARKGLNSGWRRSSDIPRVYGKGCPTHLMFLHFNDDYSLEKVWLYPWADLVRDDRFRKHNVRGNFKAFYFFVNEKKDDKYLFKM